jgi:GT2 family glycosyltransferase
MTERAETSESRVAPPEPFASVVVPTYNRRAGVLRLLEALAQQRYPAPSFEVVVVDDGSSDGTVEALRRATVPFRLTVVEQAQNAGPAAARNRGVAEARGRLIVFLDDDVVPPPELLETHVAAHGGCEDTVVIGPMLGPPRRSRPAWVGWEEEHLRIQYADMAAGRYACGPRQFYTGNASMSRAPFLAAGGFDTRFRRAEDVELAFRLRDRGARFRFSAAAWVWHYSWRSFASWSGASYQYGRYDVVMSRDNGHEALACAFVEFHERHPLTRRLVRLSLGRKTLTGGVVLALRGLAEGADRLGWRVPSGLSLSAITNLLYWQGVCDEMGGADRVWPEIDRAARGHYSAQYARASAGVGPLPPA